MDQSEAPIPNWIKWPLMASLVAFPVLSMSVNKGGMRVFAFMLLLGGLAFIVRFRQSARTMACTLKQYWPINLAMCGMIIVIFLHQVSTGKFSHKNYYEMPLRLSSFAFVLWLLMHLSGREIKFIRWGLVIGAVSSAIILFLLSAGGSVRPSNMVLSWRLIPYSDCALLIAFMALFMASWSAGSSKSGIVVSSIAVCAGLYASYLSQTRGGWLAIPFFIFMGLLILGEKYGGKWKSRRVVVAACALTLLMLLPVFLVFSNNVSNRIELARAEVASYLDGTNRDTSVGIRLQLWHGALLMIKEKPVFGVGPGNFRDELQVLAEEKIVTTVAATSNHAHNEILFQAAQYGMPGMFAMTSLFLVPAIYFASRARHADRELKMIARTGLALCGGFFVFGLTDVILRWPEAATCYVVFLAVLLALFAKRRQELIFKEIRQGAILD